MLKPAIPLSSVLRAAFKCTVGKKTDGRGIAFLRLQFSPRRCGRGDKCGALRVHIL